MANLPYDEYAEFFELCRSDLRELKTAGVFSQARDAWRAGTAARELGLERAAVKGLGGGDQAVQAINSRYKELIASGVNPETARAYAVQEANLLKSQGGYGEGIDVLRDARLQGSEGYQTLDKAVQSQQQAARAAAEREARSQAQEQARASRAGAGAGDSAADVATPSNSGGGLGMGKALALAGGTSMLAGVGAYNAGAAKQKEIGDRNRNLAFGAGMAGGAVAPQFIGNVRKMLGNMGGPQTPGREA